MNRLITKSYDKLQQKTLVVLAFCSIGNSPASGNCISDIPAEKFRKILHYLHDEGWTVINLATLLTGNLDQSGLPDKSVLLTFDCPHRTLVSILLPMLLTFGYPGVVFVHAASIGANNVLGGQEKRQEEVCDWRDLQLLENNGMSVQSQGFSQRAFSYLNRAEQLEELLFSKYLIEARLGKRIDAFAFPRGDIGKDQDLAIQLAIQAGYRVGFIYGAGRSKFPIVDKFQISRLQIQPDMYLHEIL